MSILILFFSTIQFSIIINCILYFIFRKITYPWLSSKCRCRSFNNNVIQVDFKTRCIDRNVSNTLTYLLLIDSTSLLQSRHKHRFCYCWCSIKAICSNPIIHITKFNVISLDKFPLFTPAIITTKQSVQICHSFIIYLFLFFKSSFVVSLYFLETLLLLLLKIHIIFHIFHSF